MIHMSFFSLRVCLIFLFKFNNISDFGVNWCLANDKVLIVSVIFIKCNIYFSSLFNLKCFSLGQMRSLRLFYSNKECTCGQLVIASRESQYKILHFHYGGLDKLAKIFEEYNFLSKSKNKVIKIKPTCFLAYCYSVM